MINLTPHAISIHTTSGVVTIPPSGTVARVAMTQLKVGEIDVFPPECPETDEQGNSNGKRVPVYQTSYGEVEGLPEDGVPCLVSAMVRAAVPGRKGVYSPDTGPSALRSESGQIVGVTGLIAA